MVAFVSGGGVGLLDSSAAVLGQRGVVGTAAGGQAGEGAYVNIATGNLVLQHRDDYLAAGGADLVMTRTYNAQGKLTDDNGDNWQLGLVRRVANLTGTVNTAGSTVTRIEGEGQKMSGSCQSVSQAIGRTRPKAAITLRRGKRRSTPFAKTLYCPQSNYSLH